MRNLSHRKHTKHSTQGIWAIVISEKGPSKRKQTNETPYPPAKKRKKQTNKRNRSLTNPVGQHGLLLNSVLLWCCLLFICPLLRTPFHYFFLFSPIFCSLFNVFQLEIAKKRESHFYLINRIGEFEKYSLWLLTGMEWASKHSRLRSFSKYHENTNI